VIHRDIKPANILMTSREVYGAERPRITDFGVAKLAGGDLTSTGQLLGTPAFMPPELFTGAPADGRTDLFSLGAILYRLATAEQPFPGETLTAVSYKVVHTEAIPPSKLNPAVSPQLEAVILRCLAKNPDQRYQTGEELAAALAALLPGAQPLSVHATAVAAAPFVFSGSAETIVESYSTPIPSPQPAITYVTPGPAAQTAAATGLPPAMAHPGQRKRQWWPFLALLVIVAVAVAGTTFFLTTRERPAQQAPPYAGNMPPPGPAMQSSNTPFPQGGASGAPAGFNPVNGGASAAPAGFGQVNMDPTRNAHLSLDLHEVPRSLAITLEVDGKTTWSNGSPGDQSVHARVLVPPGKHQLRVIVSGGGEPKASNVVSAAFDPGMRMNLMVQIRPRPNANSTTLDPAAHVIAILRPASPQDATGGRPMERMNAGPQRAGPQSSSDGQNAPQQ
jgi:serine/threonine-protein kinase